VLLLVVPAAATIAITTQKRARLGWFDRERERKERKSGKRELCEVKVKRGEEIVLLQGTKGGKNATNSHVHAGQP
jgi:hypothetical protein